MTDAELPVLARAHRLFAADTHPVSLATDPTQVLIHRDALQSSARTDTAHTDTAATGVVAAAHADHARARQQTAGVLAAAHADTATVADTAVAQRELMRRRAARLRAQQAHVLEARHRAQQHRAVLRGLRYRTSRRHAVRPDRLRLPPPHSRAGRAVAAALSRLGRPYVWGATGPDRFDCSGLTQWAYARAGVHLDRTTYQQIHAGIPVLRSQIQPGDLVFPSTGHVQLSLGNNQVIEAPHAGSVVKISPLGNAVAIRRPAPG